MRDDRAVTVDVDAVPAAGFVLSYDEAPADSAWHAHLRHQLLYASAGMLELDAEGNRWLLPPRRMAWIAAGTSHRVRAHPATRLRTAYLRADAMPALPYGCRVFAVPAVAREMLLHGARWDASRAPDDPLAPRFFDVLAALCLRAAETPEPFRLPTPAGDELRRATEWVLDHLDGEAAMEACAKAARVSPRTLARRFEAELGMGYRQYLQTARMTRAMELLGDPAVNVTEATYAVGFASAGAFSTAFKDFTGESPSTYRRRVLGGP